MTGYTDLLGLYEQGLFIRAGSNHVIFALLPVSYGTYLWLAKDKTQNCYSRYRNQRLSIEDTDSWANDRRNSQQGIKIQHTEVIMG
jgi:hypothetical protein